MDFRAVGELLLHLFRLVFQNDWESPGIVSVTGQ